MYINKIDELLSKILDDYYDLTVIKKSEMKKILRNDYFVKNQSSLNIILFNYSKSINKQEIKDIVLNEDNIEEIFNILKKYLVYYTFLVIGYFYEAKMETYVSNVINFSKDQSTHKFKVENFFDSDSNATIIQFYKMIKQIQTILELDKERLIKISKDPQYTKTIDFLNGLGREYIENNFRIEKLNNNKYILAHNIVKTLILKEQYLNKDKKIIYKILQDVEEDIGEYTYIDIVVPKSTTIDFNNIENVLSNQERREGIASDIYNLITDNENTIKIYDKSIEKIRYLINNKIIIPIVDDFLLYHKDSEKQYEKESSKETTKIKVIVNKINTVATLYSDNSHKKNIKKMFYTPLANRKAIIINDLEEIKIIKKLKNIGKSGSNNEYLNDLLFFRSYPYINFKDFKNYGFSLRLNKTIDVVRYASFENIDTNKQLLSEIPQMRIGSSNSIINIVGFIVMPEAVNLLCLKVNSIKNIRDYKIKGKDNKSQNGYYNINKYLKYKFKKKKLPPSYWIFDLKKDRIRSASYIAEKKTSESEKYRIMTYSLYNNLVYNMYIYILDKFNKHKSLLIYDAFKIIKDVQNKFLQFPENSEEYNKLKIFVFTKKYVKSNDEYDENEDTFYGLSKDMIKLPEYKVDKKIKMEVEKNDLSNTVCQHFITWDKIKSMKLNNPNKYNDHFINFVQRYVIENMERDFICKSCGTQIPIKNYISSSIYNPVNNNLDIFTLSLDIPLNEIKEYRKYKITISYLDKMIESIGGMLNITQVIGNQGNSKRNKLTKDLIDFIINHNTDMMKKYKNRREKIRELYGIDKNKSQLFIFQLEDDIFIYSSKEKDYYKLIKRNNILAYIVFYLVIELNKNQIMYIFGNKRCNYYLYDKYGRKMFNNLKIIVNTGGNKEPITNYNILCYLLYYISCMAVRYKKWHNIEKDETKKINEQMEQYIMIQTLIDVINSILEVNKDKYLYKLFSGMFYNSLITKFSDDDITKYHEESISKKIIKSEGKTKFVKSLVPKVKLLGYYKIITPPNKKMIFCRTPTLYLTKHVKKKTSFEIITNMTNCPNGEFHEWIAEGKKVKCKKCNILISDLKHNNKNNNIMREYLYIQIQKIANLYCKFGIMHTLVTSIKNNCIECPRCKYIEGNKLSKNKLDEFNRIYKINKQKNREYYQKRNEKINQKSRERDAKYNNIINLMKEDYNKGVKSKLSKLYFIDEFINNIKNIVGDQIIIQGTNEKINISDDLYIIDHDKDGRPINKPIILKKVIKKFHLKKIIHFIKQM